MAQLLLLNKADLVPRALRARWADHFDAAGLRYLFFSARAAIDTDAATRASTSAAAAAPDDARTRVLDAEQLAGALTELATSAHAAHAGEDGRDDGSSSTAPPRLPSVGLVGYPNVGKSSTINALFGSKRTAVAPTPGKTKHFQTLHLGPALMLCDCPGLVPPRLARSKADMVAAGPPPVVSQRVASLVAALLHMYARDAVLLFATGGTSRRWGRACRRCADRPPDRCPRAARGRPAARLAAAAPLRARPRPCASRR